VDLDLEALAVTSGALQGQRFMEPETQTIDGGAGDRMRQGGSRREDTSDCCNTEDRREAVGGLRAQERQRGLVTLEDVLREAADAAGAEAHGRRGAAVDMLAVEEGSREFLCGDAGGGCVGALSQEADFPDRGFLSPFACATEVEGRHHVLTQGAHEISPFVRRMVRLRRKTS
jgi:hypothetical protein